MLSNVSMGSILISLALICTSYFTPNFVLLHLKKCISKTQQVPLGLYFSLYITYSLFPISMILSWTMNEPSAVNDDLHLRCLALWWQSFS